MKLFHDTWLLFQRELRSTLRNPVWPLIGLFQPLCYLFLFAPLLDGVSKVPGFPPGGVFTVFTPGILVLMGVYGTLFTSFNLISELRNGFIERLSVTPVSRLALLLGRVLRDLLLLLIQALLLILISLPLGIHINPAGLALALLLLLLLGLCLASCSYAMALGLKDENALSSSLNTLAFPLVLLAGIMLPLSLAPATIRTIGAFNPLAYAVTAARLLFNGTIADVAVLEGFLIIGILALLAMLWAKSAFSRAMA